MKNHYIRKTTNALLLSTALGVMSALIPATAMAQQYWDGIDTASNNGVPTGGDGTWGGTANWTNDAAGTTNEAWAGGDAVFGGAIGVHEIELEGDQNVGNITFNDGSYDIVDTGGIAGDLVLNAGTSTFAIPSGSATVSANITGAGGLSYDGVGILYLNGDNSFSGGLTLTSGTVVLGHNNAAGAGNIIAGSGRINLNDGINAGTNIVTTGLYNFIRVTKNGSSATLSGNISGDGGIQKSGDGEIILSGTNTYTGNTTINNGTLTTQGGSAIGDLSTTSFLYSGDTLNITASETIGALIGNGFVTIGAGQTLTAGGNNSDTDYSGLMSNLNASFVKDGTGNMTFSGDGNQLRWHTVLNGTTTITGSGFFAGFGHVVSNGARLIANNTGGNAIYDNNRVSVQSGGVFEILTNETIGRVEGAGDIELNSFTLTTGDTVNVTLGSNISGTGGLIKQGSSTLTLTNNSDYTGATTINEGILDLAGSIDSTAISVNNAAQLNANANSFVATAAITLGDTATFQNSGNNIIDNISTVAGTTLNLVSGDLATGNAGNQEIAGLITGTGSLTKNGTGILTFSGANNYSGGTTIAGGTLSLQNDNAAGTGTITTTGSVIDYANGVNIANLININSNTTQLQVLAGSATQSGIISETAGPRPLEKIGTGELILTGANTYTGLTTISAGTLSLNGGAAIIDTGSVTIGASGTLNIMASETIAAMNNAGAINLTNSAIGNNLTITGDYTGVGVINVDVNFTTDIADQLIVGGNVTGTTTISVNDISTGAATGNNILVVDVAGTSSVGNFALAGGSLVSGAYTYGLTQTGSDWFLGQTLSPLTSTYEIYPQILNSLNSFSTMRQRTNSRVYKDGSKVDNGGGVGVGSIATNGDKNNNNIWGIIEASHAKVTPESSTTSSTYDNTVWKIKSGVDGLVSENENGKFIAGLNVYYGTSAANTASAFGNGSIFTQGFGVGLSGTYFANEGFYVDGQLQIGWNYSNLNSAASGALITDNLGTTYALSLEAGQKIEVGDDWILTPNAQITYSAAQFTGFDDPSGASVSLDYANSLIARVGIIVEKEQSWIADDKTGSNSSFYGLANVSYDFAGASQVDVSGTKLSTQANRWTGEVGVGTSYDWANGKYSLNAQASVTSGLQNIGSNYQYKGSLGFKAKF